MYQFAFTLTEYKGIHKFILRADRPLSENEIDNWYDDIEKDYKRIKNEEYS